MIFYHQKRLLATGKKSDRPTEFGPRGGVSFKLLKWCAQRYFSSDTLSGVAFVVQFCPEFVALLLCLSDGVFIVGSVAEVVCEPF
jgi:hypothetical protein